MPCLGSQKYNPKLFRRRYVELACLELQLLALIYIYLEYRLLSDFHDIPHHSHICKGTSARARVAPNLLSAGQHSQSQSPPSKVSAQLTDKPRQLTLGMQHSGGS